MGSRTLNSDIAQPGKDVMKYPARFSWFDRVPTNVQEEDEGTVIVIVRDEAECLNALSRAERDMRATTRSLEGTIEDSNGDSLYFGMTSYKDCGYLSYQPHHMKVNKKGHANRCPTRWSVSENAIHPTRRFGQPLDRTSIAFYQWEESYPSDMSTDYCIPLDSVKRAICVYLSNGTFWNGITWARYDAYSVGDTLEPDFSVVLTLRTD